MGAVKRTTLNLLVHRIDTALNLVFVRGAVPGSDDCFVSVRDAKKGVGYKAQAGFRKGKEQAKWLGNGVEGLPTPGMGKEGGWEGVVEWAGKGQK